MEFRIHAMTSGEYFDDPVAAYDRLAPNYASVSRRREAYLQSVEKIIASRIPADSRSLLDVGAGDGTRALRIAQEAGIRHIVLAEPSAEMSKMKAVGTEVWPVRAENLGERPGSFDVITCLWNVLGHIRGAKDRSKTLSAISRLLSPTGIFFLDVNHRYNVRSYGIVPTAVRLIHDLLNGHETNSDVIAKWSVGDSSISTYGHVFTHREIMTLARAANLEMGKRFVIDYDDGIERRFAFQGNLLYVFRRSSRIDSSNAPHTS